MNPLCIHQVGKVGSTSVLETLCEVFPGEPIHQTHVLSERGLGASLSHWLQRARREPGCKMPRNLAASVAVSRLLEQKDARGGWHLLSLVREPVGRNVSAFFENLRRAWIHHLPPESRQTCLTIFKKKSATPPDDGAIRSAATDLVELFKAGYSREFIDAWFDDEMKGVFGVDVFAEPFDRARGWHIYQSGSVRLLVMRLEDLVEAFDPAVREWLRASRWQRPLAEHGRLELKRANEAGNKSYALLHREFLAQLTFDPALLAQEYDTRTARTFYSGDECGRFAAKWAKEAPGIS